MTLQNKNHLKDLGMPHYLETGKGLASYQVKNFRQGGGGERRERESEQEAETQRRGDTETQRKRDGENVKSSDF